MPATSRGQFEGGRCATRGAAGETAGATTTAT
jgi:hypothetical protein